MHYDLYFQHVELLFIICLIVKWLLLILFVIITLIYHYLYCAVFIFPCLAHTIIKRIEHILSLCLLMVSLAGGLACSPPSVTPPEPPTTL